MADKDEVQVGDIVEVVVAKPLTGKSAEALKTQGYKKPNRLGQRARVSALQQTSKAGDVIWTTKKDGKILIKYIAFDHPDGYSLPDQPPGKPPALNDGEWKIVEKAEVPEGAERARDEEGKFEPDDPMTDDENEAYDPSSTPKADEKDDDSIGGFGDGDGGFGETSSDAPSQGDSASTPSKTKAKGKSIKLKSGEQGFTCPKASSGKSMQIGFGVQKAGWTPIVNTRSIDMEKLQDVQGSNTITINEPGFKVRLLFSPPTNAQGDGSGKDDLYHEIDSQEKYDAFLTDRANMVVREYEVGSTIKNADIVGSGKATTPSGQNIKATDEGGTTVNKLIPPTAQVVSMRLTFDDDGGVEELMVDLLDRAAGNDEDFHPQHTLQSSKFEEGGSGEDEGFGESFGGGGKMVLSPANTNWNKFYNPSSLNFPTERFVMSIEADLDNTIFKDYWNPITVNWDKAPSITVNLADGKNIGGYMKMQMSCQSGDTTNLIPGRWEDYTDESPKSSWSKYPRNVVVILPHADDTKMSIMSDSGEKMGPINEVKYHKIGEAIQSIQLISSFERDKTDEDGNVVLTDPDDPFSQSEKEKVTLKRVIEKGQEVSFDVATRAGVGIAGTETLAGEITLFSVYPDKDCSEEWEKWQGQRLAFLSLGQQTLTYIRHKSPSDNIDRYYIIVANKPGEPHTGQVIVVDKSAPNAEEPASEEGDEEVYVPEEEVSSPTNEATEGFGEGFGGFGDMSGQDGE